MAVIDFFCSAWRQMSSFEILQFSKASKWSQLVICLSKDWVTIISVDFSYKQNTFDFDIFSKSTRTV